MVITVPAYFGEVERAATRQAGELCGVTVHLLPAEPMAAAVAHGLDSSTGASTILVFDLGGGTFDVTVLCKDSVGQLTAIAHGGDRTLGGADFDKLIVERMVQQAMAELHTDLKVNPNDYADAFRVAEELKFDLSTRQRAEATIIVGGQRMQFGLSRDEFQRMLAPHVEGTELTVESALDAAKMTRADIDVVLMVGGSSRIPAFQAMLRKYFDKTPLLSKNLDEDVARGAALMGALHLGTAPKGSALALLPTPRDVSSHPIGVTVVNDLGTLENCVVLDANSPIPSPEPVERRFGVAGDGQSQIQLTVNEGDDSNLRFVDELGSAMGTFDSPRPHGYPVDVRMAFTADGILTATAHDGESGRQIAVLTVERKGAMTKQDKSTAMDLIRGLDVVDTSDAGVDDAQKPPTDDYEEI